MTEWTNEALATRLRGTGEGILSSGGPGFEVYGQSAVAFGALLINAAKALEQQSFDCGGQSVTLSGAMLKDALEFVAPDNDPDQLETEVVIEWCKDRQSAEGEPMPAGYYAWLAEYPEEGCIPLGRHRDRPRSL